MASRLPSSTLSSTGNGAWNRPQRIGPSHVAQLQSAHTTVNSLKAFLKGRVLVTCQSDPSLQRPKAPKPPLQRPTPPTPIAPKPPTTPFTEAPTEPGAAPETETGPTIAFQRRQARALREYFESLKDQEIAQQPVFGFTPANEIGNGRWVMFGLLVGLLTEYATGVNFIDQLKLIVSNLGIADIYD